MAEHKIVIVFDEDENRVEVQEAPFANAVVYYGMLKMAEVVMMRRLAQAEMRTSQPILIPAPFIGKKPS